MNNKDRLKNKENKEEDGISLLFLSFQVARTNSLWNISYRGLAAHLKDAVSHDRLPAKKCPFSLFSDLLFPWTWWERQRCS